MTEYTFIRSKRKTIGITVKPDGSVIVRAPLGCSKKRAEIFVLEKQEWIEKARRKMAERRAEAANGNSVPVFSKAEITALKKQARNAIPPLVAQIANEIGVTYGTISIRAQKARWGSCLTPTRTARMWPTPTAADIPRIRAAARWTSR